MSEREYAKRIIDIIPEEQLSSVIEYMLSISGEEYAGVRDFGLLNLKPCVC